MKKPRIAGLLLFLLQEKSLLRNSRTRTTPAPAAALADAAAHRIQAFALASDFQESSTQHAVTPPNPHRLP
jgi:hypothetical protein